MKIYQTLALALCAFFTISCGMVGKTGRTPTETLKALNEASKKKDVEAIKKLLSKGTLTLLDKAAQDAKKTPDELLRQENGAPLADLPEILGEKIEGDTAYVEIKNSVTSEKEQMPLVREDGEWKVALDKYLDTMRQRLTEEMNKTQNAEKPAENQTANKK